MSALKKTDAKTDVLPEARRSRLALALLAGALAFASWWSLPVQSTQAAGDCTVAAGEVAIDGEEQAMLDGINLYRQQNGLGPLSFSPTLNRASAWMSHDMAVKRYFSHSDSLGRTFDVRLADCGYTFATYKGENIAAGNADAASTLIQWKTSPPHNAAMLTSSYRAAGLGRYYDAGAPYRWYWTLDLGGYVDSGLVTAPTATSVGQPAATSTATSVPSGGMLVAPTNLRPGSATGSSLQVLWNDSSSNETKFQLAYRETSAAAWSYADAPANATSATVSGLNPNTSFYFYVRACHATGCSDWSNYTTGTTSASAGAASTATPTPVPSPTATAVPTATGLPTSTATGVPSATRTLVPSQTGVPSATRTLVPSQTAVPSATATSVPTSTGGAGTTVPSAPTDLRSGGATSSSLQLQWNDTSHNETRFQVAYQALGAGGWSYADAPANATSLNVSGLGGGTTHFAYVRACNSAGCSAWSNSLTASTL